MSLDTTTPKSRRAMLAGALGGLAGLVAGRLGHPEPADAVAGSPLIIGSSSNNAGTANTQLLTNSNIVAFNLYQQGPGTALMGYTTPTSGQTRGVYGRVDSPNGDGVQARNAGAAGTGAAVRAFGGNNDGIVATTDSADRTALTATNTSDSADDAAITGLAYNASPADTHPSGAQSFFKAAGEFAGVNGVLGASIPAADNGVGVVGVSPGSAGYGVYGYTPDTGTGLSYGVYGRSDGTQGTGVRGYASAGSGAAWGVWGDAAGAGIGVYGSSSTGYALYGLGDGAVTGSFAKASGTFKIDHPLDPANKFLEHSFVESPDMMNIYNGVVTTDAQGKATVELPDWFDALNRDVRYQLTPIGDWTEAWVSKEVKGNQFGIATSTPNTKISWQVTGIRHDPWAEHHRVIVESAKTGNDKGRYLHPVEHGQPKRKGIGYAAQQRAKAAARAAQSGAPVGR